MEHISKIIKDNPNYDKFREKKCIICGGNLKRGIKFCSVDCYGKYKKTNGNSGQFKKGHKPLKPFLKGHVPHNKGKNFVHKGSFKKGHKFRATPEGNRRKAEKMMGSNNFFWQGGLTTPERIRYLCSRYRARRLNAEGSFKQKEWEDLKKKFNYTCLCCKKKEPEIKLTIDHIMPLSKGGSDYIENIQPLCGRCNRIKNVKYINYKHENTHRNRSI